jgi:hypothetical protein
VETSGWIGALVNDPSFILALSTSTARLSFSQYIIGVPMDIPQMPEKRDTDFKSLKNIFISKIPHALYSYITCLMRAHQIRTELVTENPITETTHK